jgi:predicted transcriptional regulator
MSITREEDVVSETTSLTVDLPNDVVDGLESLAASTGQDVSELAEADLAEYLAVQRWQYDAIVQAVAEADAGARTYSNEEVMAWLESWETPDELPPPT